MGHCSLQDAWHRESGQVSHLAGGVEDGQCGGAGRQGVAGGRGSPSQRRGTMQGAGLVFAVRRRALQQILHLCLQGIFIPKQLHLHRNSNTVANVHCSSQSVPSPACYGRTSAGHCAASHCHNTRLLLPRRQLSLHPHSQHCSKLAPSYWTLETDICNKGPSVSVHVH